MVVVVYQKRDRGRWSGGWGIARTRRGRVVMCTTFRGSMVQAVEWARRFAAVFGERVKIKK